MRRAEQNGASGSRDQGRPSHRLATLVLSQRETAPRKARRAKKSAAPIGASGVTGWPRAASAAENKTIARDIVEPLDRLREHISAPLIF
jgi:hypothetical protein